MSKITFITPKGTRTPGIQARCSKKGCLNPADHVGPHAYRVTPSAQAEQNRPKQKQHVSKITKLDCLAMIEDPVYRQRLLRDLRARRLRPAVECLLWYYAKGKPKEMVEHSGTLTLQDELSNLTTEELKQRALAVAKMLSTESIH